MEEGYRTFLMQHKYPFVVLYLTIDPEKIDVNVHPTKMDIRINEPQTFFRFLQESVAAAINGRSLVTSMDAKIEKEEDKKAEKQLTREIPQPFEAGRRSQSQVRETSSYGQSYGQIVQKALQKVDEELAQPAQSGVREEKTGYTTSGSDVRRSLTPEKNRLKLLQQGSLVQGRNIRKKYRKARSSKRSRRSLLKSHSRWLCLRKTT